MVLRLFLFSKELQTIMITNERLLSARTKQSNAAKRLLVFFFMVCLAIELNAQNYVVTANKLNVRSSPATGSKVVGSLSEGDAVQVTGINGEWATISYGGKKCYVNAKFLKKQNSGNRNQRETAEHRSTSVSTTRSMETKRTSTDTSPRKNTSRTSDHSKKNGPTQSIEFQPVFGVDKGAEPGFDLLYSLGWDAAKYFNIGGAVGISESFKFKTAPTIPLLVRATFENQDGEISPFMMLDAGFGFNLENFDYSAIIVNPTIGCRLNNILLGVGYRAGIPTKGSGVSSAINLKIGYRFGNFDSAFWRYIRKTWISMEAGCQFGESAYYYYGKSNLLWNFPCSDQFSVSVGSGVVIEFSDGDGIVNVPVFTRGKYRFTQLGKTIVPFVQCDFGTNISTHDYYKGGVMIELNIQDRSAIS